MITRGTTNPNRLRRIDRHLVFLLSGVLLIAVGWWVHRRGVRDMARRAARGGQSGGRAGGRVIR